MARLALDGFAGPATPRVQNWLVKLALRISPRRGAETRAGMSESPDQTEAADGPRPRSRRGAARRARGGARVRGRRLLRRRVGAPRSDGASRRRARWRRPSGQDDRGPPTSPSCRSTPIMISLAPAAGARTLRFSGALEVAPESAAEVAGLMPRVLDVLNTYLRAVEVRDIEEPAIAGEAAGADAAPRAGRDRRGQGARPPDHRIRAGLGERDGPADERPSDGSDALRRWLLLGARRGGCTS